MSVRGIAGESILSGSGAPANSLGRNGVKYFDTSNLNLYPAKTSGVWGVPTSIKGDKGDTGDPGTGGGTWTGDINMDGNEITNVGNLETDNIKIDGNTISSTDTNGDIILEPNGNGKIKALGTAGTLEMDAGTISKVDSITFEADPTGIDFGGTNHVFKQCKDEDDMASDSEDAVATQQSIKAYVDNKTDKYDHIILTPADWMPSDGSSTYNAAIYDYVHAVAGMTEAYGALRTTSSSIDLYAYKVIPKGYKATSLDIWINMKLSSDTTDVTVYEKFWDNTTPVSKGTLACTGSTSALYQLNFTDITADGDNMVMIHVDPSGNTMHLLGAKIYITEV